MLSDRTIRLMVEKQEIRLDPMPEDFQFQSASVDLRLGNKFIGIGRHADSPFEANDGFLWMQPGDCLLGESVERIELPANVVGRVEGKSSLGRQFLSVHSTAGFIDPGFRGSITLEIKNNGPRDLMLKPGQLICQISFEWLSCPADRPYGHPALFSKYQDQRGPVTARTR